MKSKSYKKIFKSRDTFRQTWTIGLLSLLIYKYYDLNFYHFYLYFFIVGAIPLIASLQAWAILTRNYMILYKGVLFRKNICIKWEDIKALEIIEIKKRKYFVSGGFNPTPASLDIEYSAISIKLKNDIVDYNLNDLVINKKSSFFPIDMFYKKDENQIIINSKPDGSVEDVFEQVSMFYKKTYDLPINFNKFMKKKFKFIYDLFLLLTVLFILIQI